jgi:flagellar hook-length control protein FliK
MRLLIRESGGSLHLRLDPPELGHVRLHLDLSGDRARGWVEVSSREAHQVFEHNAGQLRRSLQEHGIHLESFTVRAEAESASNGGFRSPGWGPNPHPNPSIETNTPPAQDTGNESVDQDIPAETGPSDPHRTNLKTGWDLIA